jgi:hypothetical protein
MDVVSAVRAIQRRFAETGSPAEVPLLRGGSSFTAELRDEGVVVSNLRAQPFLPWAAFQEAVCVLMRNGGRARRGNAMNCRLGDPGLPLDSVEGHVAYAVYGKRVGDSVFRRITPVACILTWAGVCEAAPGELERHHLTTDVVPAGLGLDLHRPTVAHLVNEPSMSWHGT